MRRALRLRLAWIGLAVILAACGGGGGGGGGDNGSGGDPGGSTPAMFEVVNDAASVGEIFSIFYTYEPFVVAGPSGTNRYDVGLDPGDAYSFPAVAGTIAREIRVLWFDGAGTVVYRAFGGGSGVVTSGGPGVTRITVTRN
ncbi:MAG: hypothetical protein IT460_12315 [Planctomycetes bacterium]|nr:hypothetical protein [Planctomycetota bacterium]